MRGSRKILKKGTCHLGQIKKNANFLCELTLPKMKPCKYQKAPYLGARGRINFPFFFSVQDVKCPHRENGQFLTHGPYEFRLIHIRIKADYLGLEHMYNPIN